MTDTVSLSAKDQRAQKQRSIAIGKANDISRGFRTPDPTPPLSFQTQVGYLELANPELPQGNPYSTSQEIPEIQPNQLLDVDLRKRSVAGLTTVPFRSLFGKRIEQLSLEHVVRFRRINDINDVPEAHRMRAAAWKMASEILPRTGQVKRIEGRFVYTTLQQVWDPALDAGTDLIVVRPAVQGRPEQILDARPVVREFTEERAVAVLDPRHGQDLRVGDLVYRRPSQIIRVFKLGTQVKLGDFDGHRYGTQILEYLQNIAGRFLLRFSEALDRVGAVTTEDRSEATHGIQVDLVGSSSKDWTAPVRISIIDLETQEQLNTVNFIFYYDMPQLWLP